MTIIYNNKEAFERIKKYLTENQYNFEYAVTNNGWKVIIKEWY